LSGILKPLKEERAQVERQLSGLVAAIRAFANVYNPQLDQRRAVTAQKIIEVAGTSKESFAKAAENTVAEEAKTSGPGVLKQDREGKPGRTAGFSSLRIEGFNRFAFANASVRQPLRGSRVFGQRQAAEVSALTVEC
jgi:hypothetical protein